MRTRRDWLRTARRSADQDPVIPSVRVGSLVDKNWDCGRIKSGVDIHERMQYSGHRNYSRCWAGLKPLALREGELG